MDRYHIDAHKLSYHVTRVSDWIEGKLIYPIYMEISPSGACNHRCTYCALDFMEYQRRFLDSTLLAERLAELGRLGVKSVMYAGEGEPLLHRDLPAIVQRTAASGIDAALTTNGVLLDEDRARGILPFAQWIKVSINAGTAATYAQIHRCRPTDFERTIANMARAASIRRGEAHACTLGMQIVLLPENAHEVVTLAAIARDIGMDYLVVKPYSRHPQSRAAPHTDLRYADYEPLAKELARFEAPGFDVIFRAHTMAKLDQPARGYARCLALPFWSYIDAGGNVWGCSMFLGDPRFEYGNIREQTFEQIWTGPRRLESLRWVDACLDPAGCRVNCRMDEVNRHLWDLTHPPRHVNFI